MLSVGSSCDIVSNCGDLLEELFLSTDVPPHHVYLLVHILLRSYTSWSVCPFIPSNLQATIQCGAESQLPQGGLWSKSYVA